ncbi:MAG: DUF5678 domain-containing protein [Blastocatellia bacterium]
MIPNASRFQIGHLKLSTVLTGELIMLTERVQSVLQQIETLNLDEKQSLVEFITLQERKGLAMQPNGQSERHPERDIEAEPEFNQELGWLREHRHEYGGQYVALVGDNIVANGLEPRAVLHSARNAGYPSPLVVRLEAPDELPFGGW